MSVNFKTYGKQLESVEDMVWNYFNRFNPGVFNDFKPLTANIHNYVSDMVKHYYGAIIRNDTPLLTNEGISSLTKRMADILPQIILLDSVLGNSTSKVIANLPVNLAQPNPHQLLGKIVHYTGNIFSVAHTHDEALAEGLMGHDTVHLTYFLMVLFELANISMVTTVDYIRNKYE